MAIPCICSVEDCTKPAGTRGWCAMHYGRWLRHGDLNKERDGRAICSIEGCGSFAYGQGWCSKHYQRWQRNGDPLAGRTAEGDPAEWLIAALCQITDDCILWPFAHTRAGYGVINTGSGNVVVPRFICETMSGPPPLECTDTAHSCNDPHCCNFQHLRWDTRAGNMTDAIASGTWVHGTRCKQAKLNEAAVREIRRLQGVELQATLAERFNVGSPTISQVQNRKSWAWLD